MSWTKGSEHVVTIQDISFDGLGISTTPSGKRVEVLNALPGEELRVQVMKRKRGSILAVATEVITASSLRKPPQDEAFLSGSLWDIIDIKTENTFKQQLIEKLFISWGIEHPEIVFEGSVERYRNKAEFSMYGDFDTGKLSLSFHRRGTKRGKIPITDSILFPKPIISAGQTIIDAMNAHTISRDVLKVIQVRYSFSQQTTTAYVYVTDTTVAWDWISECIDTSLVGIEVIYSDPRSPASVSTETLHIFGTTTVRETILGQEFQYPGHGFFQINPGMFELALQDICDYVETLQHPTKLLDLYAGVGVIGLSCSPLAQEVVGVELFPESQEYALRNRDALGIFNYTFIEGAVEANPEILQDADCVLLDPPRAGLHPKVIKALREYQPEHIIYLSCNPKTQKLDIEALMDIYQITKTQAYNFYPKTPHIEHLVCLSRK